jgi:hypothetical protein
MLSVKHKINAREFSSYAGVFFLSRCLIFAAPFLLLATGDKEQYVLLEYALGVSALLAAIIGLGQVTLMVVLSSESTPNARVELMEHGLVLRALPFFFFPLVLSNESLSLVLCLAGFIVIQSARSGLYKVNGHRIVGLISEAALYLVVSFYAALVLAEIIPHQSINLSDLISIFGIGYAIATLRGANWLCRSAWRIERDHFRRGITLLFSAGTLVLAVSFPRVMIPSLNSLDDQVIFAATLRYTMVALVLHQFVAGVFFQDLYRKDLSFIIKVKTLTGLCVSALAMLILFFLYSGRLGSHVIVDDLSLIIGFACNVSLISMLSFFEILNQRCNLAARKRLAVFTKSLVFFGVFIILGKVSQFSISSLVAVHTVFLMITLCLVTLSVSKIIDDLFWSWSLILLFGSISLVFTLFGNQVFDKLAPLTLAFA